MSTYRLYILKTLEDHKDADSFLALTKQRLKTIKSHKFTWWDPSLLLPGDEREAEINKHLVGGQLCHPTSQRLGHVACRHTHASARDSQTAPGD